MLLVPQTGAKVLKLRKLSFDFLIFFQSLVLIYFCLFLLKDPAYIVAIPYVLVNFLQPLILNLKCLDFTCATRHVVID